jgi:hypothetical protein
MAELPQFNYGGYVNNYLTAAEIASRSYNAGDPPSVVALNTYQNVVWTPCRMMVGTIPTMVGVAVDNAGNIVWRDLNSGSVTINGGGLGSVLFTLPGGLGVGLFNQTTGVSFVLFNLGGTWSNVGAFTGKYLRSAALEHDYWGGSWGTNY